MRATRVAASTGLVALLTACSGSPGAPTQGFELAERPASDIQAMIEAAAPGSTVRVPVARYVGAVVIDRPVTLEAEPGAVLDGDGEGSVVEVVASGVTLRGFRIQGSGTGPIGEPSGVLVEAARNVRLEGLVIEQTYLGITVRETRGVLIEDVRIRGRAQATIVGEEHAVANGEGDHEDHGAHAAATGAGLPRGDGIWLWNTQDAVVRTSRIEATRDGIYLSYGERIVLEDNVISDARYAIHDMYARDLAITGNVLRGNLSGCVLMYGGPVRVLGNAVVDSGSPSTGFGVLVKDAGDVLVRGNVILDDRVAVHVDDAGRTGGAPARFERNLIAANHVGVVLYPSARPTFTGNAFVENAAQVVLGGSGVAGASWSVDGIGNHWSDYQGFDADGDGIGDVPYAQSGRLAGLVARSPVLLALASGPALRLVEAVEERWVPSEPLVLDPAPLLHAVRPDVPRFTPREAGSGTLVWAGLLMAGVGGAGLALARRGRGGARRA